MGNKLSPKTQFLRLGIKFSWIGIQFHLPGVNSHDLKFNLQVSKTVNSYEEVINSRIINNDRFCHPRLNNRNLGLNLAIRDSIFFYLGFNSHDLKFNLPVPKTSNSYEGGNKFTDFSITEI